MRNALKRAALLLARGLSLLAGLVPFALRRVLVTGLLVVESRIGPPGESLKRLFAIWDDVDRLVNERATAYGGGVNPKHRLTGYHDFFVENIPEGSRVLDVGCGVGAVARSIAGRVPGAEVLGVDIDGAAFPADPPTNLSFVVGDATRELPPGPWDAVVLSNVLEHIEDRQSFLERLIRNAAPKTILIRVPLFERDWRLALRRELWVNYFSDPTHFIEHTLDAFAAETTAAGLAVTEMRTIWGEIWAVCEVSAHDA